MPSPAGPSGAEEPAPKQRSGRNVPVAIATGVSLGGALLGLLFSTRVGWDAFAGCAILIGLYELYTVVRQAGYEPAASLGIAGGAAMMAGAAWRGAKAISFVLVLIVIASFLWYLADPNRRNVMRNVSVTVFGVVYTALLGSHVMLMRDLHHGPAITVTWILLVVCYDVGAYAAGSLFGKHKLAPAISPGKTWEGAAGATIFVFAVATVCGAFITPWTIPSVALLAGSICIAAPLGDLAESVMKRDIGVKDFGNILPGHGGILDRIDALLFTAPIAFWIARWLLR